MMRYPFKLLFLLGLSGFISACSTELPTSAPLTSTLSHPSPQASATPVSTVNRPIIQVAWWQRFNDPLMAALIQEAWQANPSLQTAQASIQSARAQGVIAGASLLPSINGSLSARDSSSTSPNWSLGADASWELDLFGGNRLTATAANNDLKAAQANYEDVKASLAAEVASAYVNLRLAQARLSVAKQTERSRQETMSLTEMRLKVGLDSALTTEQARLSLGQNQANLPILESAVQRAQHALAALTGKNPQALAQRLATIKPIPSAIGRIQPSIPANALRQRSDIRAAEYQIAAAQARVGAAKADLYPSFNLSGTLTNSGLTIADILDPAAIVKTLIASISAPLFNGGKLKQQVVLKDAAYNQALAHYQQTLLTALKDIADGFATLQGLEQQQPILQKNLATARSTEHLANLSYQAGVDDFQNVLDAQQSILSTQESILSAQAEYSLALISLYKAVGGAW